MTGVEEAHRGAGGVEALGEGDERWMALEEGLKAKEEEETAFLNPEGDLSRPKGVITGANAGQAIAHGVVDNAQHALPQTSGQAMLQSDSYPDPRVAAAQPDPRKSQLTSAQLAIQQGKLQQRF